MTAMLELRQVSKVYGSGPTMVQAIGEVDLSVDGGELVAVMGPSGSGKSTLLTIAGSLEDPTSGEVLVGGSALSGMTGNQRARLRRRQIGYVFQDFNLLAGLTAVENAALPWSWTASAGAPPGQPAWPRSRSWAWPTGPAAIPTSCRAGSGSEWRSPGPWSATVGCCWPTSRPGRWTRSAARR
jgi:ABC-type sugar transport system ATPase subunit